MRKFIFLSLTMIILATSSNAIKPTLHDGLFIPNRDKVEIHNGVFIPQKDIIKIDKLEKVN